MKVDICLVTKNGMSSIKGIEHVPLANLIVETSSPLGLARQKAIQNVSTEWFAFVDDDVELFPNWYKTLSEKIDHSIGAISGYLMDCGYGDEVDSCIAQQKTEFIDYRLGERWTGTHHGLIRTELVKDWEPSRPDLSSWEDYEITQHILRKGFRVVKIPVYLGYHHKGWKHIYSNAFWNLEGQIKTKGMSVRYFLSYLRTIIQIPHILLMPWNLSYKMFLVYTRICLLLAYFGMLRKL